MSYAFLYELSLDACNLDEAEINELIRSLEEIEKHYIASPLSDFGQGMKLSLSRNYFSLRAFNILCGYMKNSQMIQELGLEQLILPSVMFPELLLKAVTDNFVLKKVRYKHNRVDMARADLIVRHLVDNPWIEEVEIDVDPELLAHQLSNRLDEDNLTRFQ